MTSHVLMPKTILQHDNKIEQTSFITSYIPIIDTNLSKYPVDGVLEINTDITNLWASITKLEKKVLLAFGIILILFFAILKLDFREQAA